MNAADLKAMLPLLILSAASVFVMIAIAIRRNHAAAMAISVGGVVASLLSLFPAASTAPRQITSLLIFDSYGLLYITILLCAALFVILFGYDYLKVRREHPEEFYLLVLLATAGAMTLVVSRHFVSFFLGLELLSVALYALIGYTRDKAASVEAAIKYLILAASASSVLLFGLALIYATTGSMEISVFTSLPANVPAANQKMLLAGLLLIVTGIGFKLAVVPFHFWTPEVYEGSPLPVTAFIATVSKGGMFALLLRWFHFGSRELNGTMGLVLSLIAIASILTGNLLALRQSNLKRILAYSSIAHMGYLLVGLIAGAPLGGPSATYYLTAYLATILGAFGVMAALSGSQNEKAYLDEYHGLFWRRPGIAAVLSVMMLSLAGVPLTAGFLGKFYVVVAGASQARWILVFTLVIGSTIGLFYYLRVLLALFAQPEDSNVAASSAISEGLPIASAVALAGITLLVLVLGTYPAPFWNIIQNVTREL